jgi:hypothetical protein
MTDDDDRSRDDVSRSDASGDNAATDERDERVTAFLEVPPLDDVTRRRLVTRALASGDERPRRASRRLLVPAAAALVVLILVAVGALVLVTRGDGDGGTAARSTTAAPGAPQDRRPTGEAPPPAGISDLGDLGELGETADLRRRVGDALRDPAPVERATAPACLDRALTGSPAPSAYGAGTHGGRPVLVLVLPSRGDNMTVVLLDQETCRAVTVVNLS